MKDVNLVRNITAKAAELEAGGLPRRAALLEALKICSPGDYAGCMESAAAYPDGENALYEYLEDATKSPRTHEKGPPLNAGAKKTQGLGIAPDAPPKRTGLEGLREYVKKGIAG